MILAMATGFSCNKDSSPLCGGDRPEKELAWLKDKIQELSTSPYCYGISRGVYRDRTVFVIMNCEPDMNSIPVLYDCNGMQLNLSTIDYQELKFTGAMELIWKNRK